MNKELLCDLFDYKNGELYWKMNRGSNKVAGKKAGKKKHLGYFHVLELAELVAIEARDKYHKEFANHG